MISIRNIIWHRVHLPVHHGSTSIHNGRYLESFNNRIFSKLGYDLWQQHELN